MDFITREGKPRKALVFVDLGSPTLILSKALYTELSVDSNQTLGLRIGEMSIAVESADVTNDAWLPFSIGEGRKVEALLPAGVLRKYQVRFDYANHSLTLAQPETLSRLDPHDLDYVGLTLLSRHGEYYIGRIATRRGRPTVTGAQVGDKLVQVGVLASHGASREALFGAMHGKPGAVRQLVVERDGRLIEINTRVTAF